MTPPRAGRRPTRRVLFGREHIDEYAYLRHRADPDTRRYIDEENTYANAVTATWQADIDTLFDELRGRVAEDDCSVAERIGDYWYYTRIEAGQEYPLHCRKHGELTADEEIYLDENQLAYGHGYFELAGLEVSPCHGYVAYSVDRHGEERYELVLRDLCRGSEIGQPVPDAGCEFVWGEPGSLYYTRVDGTARPCAVYLHRLGQSGDDDVLLFGDSDPAFHVSVWVSRSREYLFVESCSNTTTEVHYLRLGEGSQRLHCFAERQTGIEYYVDHRDDRFLVLTNEDAPNFRLLSMAVDQEHARDDHEMIAARDDVTLVYVEAYARFVIVGELKQGIEQVRVLDDCGGDRYIDFDDPVYSIELEDLDDYHADFIRLHYSSPVRPAQTMDYELSSRRRRVRKRDRVRDYAADDYLCRRLWVGSGGGARVPLTLVHSVSLPLDGTHPLLMCGYGAYGESLEMEFDPDLVSLLRRGAVLAMVHVRGGGELGPGWHDDGRLLNKENSFDDFFACLRHLIDAGYSAAGRIAVWGGSAGGLLVAVMANRYPEYLAAVVAEVPFVDVVNTLLDPSLPLTVHDFEEFGDPSRREYFDYLCRYSPYENVAEQSYPAMFVSAGMDDSRVAYWEPLKWVARLRAAKRDQRLLLLRLERSGHYGASGRYDQWRQTAAIHTFLLHSWGISV